MLDSDARRLPRRLLVTVGLLLLGGVLACAVASLAMRSGLLEPVPVRVALGGLALDTTIENRICLQRVLHRPCRAPTYTLRVSYDAPGGTRYVATVTHWSVAASQRHEAMGFHEGWGVCADQLEALARTL